MTGARLLGGGARVDARRLQFERAALGPSRPLRGAPPPRRGPLATTVGETLGTGPVRVGMILPLTQNGAPSPIGVSMRNAAQLAIDEFSGPSITLMVQDDRSSPDGAAQAAQAEVGAGAQLILGPVYANDVRQAASAAKAAGRPMIAFSTDVSVAASRRLPAVVPDRDPTSTGSPNSPSRAARRRSRSMAPQNDYAQRRRSPSSSRWPAGSTRRSW